MQLPRVIRSDLVISMTLAEIFLLLLFVVWNSLTKGPPGKPPPPWGRIIEQLEAEKKALAAQLREARKSADELRRLTQVWEDNWGVAIPGSKEAVKAFIAEAGRGYPKCQDNNVLVHVSEVNGHETMAVATNSPELWQFFDARGGPRPPIGTEVAAPRVAGFLAGVSAYYHDKSRTSKGCRFDYWLTYATAEDYLHARRKFEDGGYFYAGRISLAGSAKK